MTIFKGEIVDESQETLLNRNGLHAGELATIPMEKKKTSYNLIWMFYGATKSSSNTALVDTLWLTCWFSQRKGWSGFWQTRYTAPLLTRCTLWYTRQCWGCSTQVSRHHRSTQLYPKPDSLLCQQPGYSSKEPCWRWTWTRFLPVSDQHWPHLSQEVFANDFVSDLHAIFDSVKSFRGFTFDLFFYLTSMCRKLLIFTR